MTGLPQVRLNRVSHAGLTAFGHAWLLCLCGGAFIWPTCDAYAQGRTKPWATSSCSVEIWVAETAAHPAEESRLLSTLNSTPFEIIGPAMELTARKWPVDGPAPTPCFATEPADEVFGKVTAATRADKLLLVWRRPGRFGGASEALVREFDTATGWVGAIVRTPLGQTRAVGPRILAACRSAFSPSGRVVRVLGRDATIRFRGELFDFQPSDWAAPGRANLWMPLVTSRMRQGEKKAQEIPWTYLRWSGETSAGGSFQNARIISALSRPLPDRVSPLRPVYVTRVASDIPQRGAIEIVLKNRTTRPATGLTVKSLSPLSGEETNWGGTDETGKALSPGPLTGLLWLTVLHGDRPLAAGLPYVPGGEASLTLPAGLVSESAGSGLEQLRATVVDLAVRRRLVADRVQRAIASNDTAAARAGIAELRDRTDLELMTNRIAQDRREASLPARRELDALLSEVKATLDGSGEASAFERRLK